MECICNIFGSCMREPTDDVKKKTKDDETHVTFDLGSNTYSGVAPEDPVNPKSSFDSVDLTGGDDQETSSDVG